MVGLFLPFLIGWGFIMRGDNLGKRLVYLRGWIGGSGWGSNDESHSREIEWRLGIFLQLTICGKRAQ